MCVHPHSHGGGAGLPAGDATGTDEWELTRQRGKDVQEEGERRARPTCSLKEPEAQLWRQREGEEGASVGRHRRGLEQERGRDQIWAVDIRLQMSCRDWV